MQSISQITPDRWADLVITVSQNRQKPIVVDKILLSDHQLIRISQEKISGETSPVILEKMVPALQTLLQQRQKELVIAQSLFSVQFARWANNHVTLGKILIIVTLGIFWVIWKRGYQTIQDIENTKSVIFSYKELISAFENRLPRNSGSCFFPKDLFGIILEYLRSEELKEILEWKPVEEALAHLDERKWKVVRSYQQKILDRLDKDKYKTEIENIKNLDERLKNHEEFNDVTVLLERKEKIIIDQIGTILPLANFQSPKKYKNLLNDPFFAILAVNMYSLRDSPFALLPEAMRKDKEVLIALLKANRHGTNAAIIPDHLKEDREFLLAFIKYNARAILYTPLINDREFVLEALKINGNVHRLLPDHFKSDRKMALEAVKRKGLAIIDMCNEFKQDPEIALAALQYGNPVILHYLSPELLKREEILFECLRNLVAERTERFLDKEKMKDKNYVLKRVELNPGILLWASNDLKKDREVVLKAVQKDGYSLKYAHKDLQNDFQIVYEAVKTNRFALMDASKELKNNKTIGLVAVKKYWEALQYLSNELKDDDEIISMGLKQSYEALLYASKRIKSNRPFILKTMSIRETYRYIADELKNDREILLKALEKDIYAFQFTSKEFKADREICLSVVKRNGALFQYVDRQFQDDEEMAFEAVKNNGQSLEFVSERLRNDKNFVIRVLKLNEYSAWGFSYLPNHLKADKEVVLSAVTGNGILLQIAHQFKNDKDIVLAAVKQNDYALTLASEALQRDPDVLAACGD